jgi:uncharacterized protein
MKFISFIFAYLFLICGLSALDFQETKQLAEGGNSIAQQNLGQIYRFGKGVPQDNIHALGWYTKSADQGNAKAQCDLGFMYYEGEGVPQDDKEAFAWWSVAKANGEELAEKNLGIVTKEMTKEQIAEAQSLATEIQKRIEVNKKD